MRCVVASVSHSAVGGSPLSSPFRGTSERDEEKKGGGRRRDLALLHLRSLSLLKKGSPIRTDRSTSYSLPHRDVYLVTGLADCIVITVLNILHRARELTNSAMGWRWPALE